MLNSAAPLSIYLHIPFCRARCSYCAFNTYTDLAHLMPAYIAALSQELQYAAAQNPHHTVETVYFGGGTPSLLSPAQFEQLLEQLQRHFPLSAAAEISLEANPDNLTADYLRDLRRLSFNRLSIGMQSADARILRLYEREHDLAAVATAVDAARAAGFENISLDVIFAAPGETVAAWRRTVAQVLRFAPAHISMYGLELKGGTKLRQQVDAGALPRPDDDDFADMYESAAEALASQGYAQYEISNWCRPGRQCRHSLQYWRNLPYLGLGAGAHGFAGGYRYTTIAAPARYIAALADSTAFDAPFPLTPAVAKSTRLDAAAELYETIMMRLRLTGEGIDRARFQRRFGQDFAVMFPQAIEKLSALGLLVVTDSNVHLSERGRLLSNAVIREFVERISLAE